MTNRIRENKGERKKRLSNLKKNGNNRVYCEET